MKRVIQRRLKRSQLFAVKNGEDWEIRPYVTYIYTFTALIGKKKFWLEKTEAGSRWLDLPV